jgi:hypothetical protein
VGTLGKTWTRRDKASPEVRAGRVRAARRKWDLKDRYGLTPERFDEMVVDQEGRCAICRREFPQTPHVDHDHETGKVRGLLCRRCNIMLGWFDRMGDQAMAYLTLHAISGPSNERPTDSSVPQPGTDPATGTETPAS